MLEITLASPLMTLFSNQLSFSESTHILNLFILDGEPFLLDLFSNIIIQMKDEIMKMDDLFEL